MEHESRKSLNTICNWSKEKRLIALDYIENIYNKDVRNATENLIKEEYARRNKKRNNKRKSI